MIERSRACRVCAAVLFGAFLAVAVAAAAQTKIPGGVASRLKKIGAYLDTMESRIQSGSSSRNDLDRAMEDLKTIKKSYPDFASHKDVVAAEKRIMQVEKSFNEAQSGRQEKRAREEKEAAANDRIFEEWAERLSRYKTDSDPGSRGNFGVPTEDVERLQKNNRNYEAAKSLYAEFLKTGIDKEAHYKLRQAEYDIKVSIRNYEDSRERIPAAADAKLDEAIKWMKEQKTGNRQLSLNRDQRRTIDLYVENSNRLFPNTGRVNKLNARKAELDKLIEDADKSILENRRMKPAQYRGADSGELTNMAKSIVLKANPGASILKVNITSRDWERESVLEWTDTTRSALQGRVTDGIYAQVSAAMGGEWYLFTLFLNKDTIGGKTRPLTGHVMYKERILEKNAR